MGHYDAILAVPFGRLGLCLVTAGLARIDFLPGDTPPRAGDVSLAQEVAAQLAAYFADPSYSFDLPLAPSGTDFRRRVWRALRDIPVGECIRYGELASRLGSGARAVGQALGDNPLPILIPCHRVVAASGLGGFNHGVRDLDIKRWLLAHEGGREG